VCYRFTRHEHSLSGLTAVWLQPSVATIVSAATGSIVAEYLDPSRAQLTVVVSYIIWGLGFLPAILIMSSYFLRLAVHKASSSRTFFCCSESHSVATYHQCPPNALVVSSFLPLGPCGQGAFALLKLSTVVRKLCLRSVGTDLYSKEDLRMFGNAVYAGTIP
jgi:tellurite resistance protein TehA-like permease